MISTFYIDYTKKPTATSVPIYFTPPIAKAIAKQIVRLFNATKRKCGQPAKTSIKQTREV